MFVWDVEEGSVVAELRGHEAAVWGVMVYDEKLIFTACADKMIRVFDINGKSLKTIQGHTDVVRCLCKLPSDHWSGAAFASAGNDEVIRLWTMDGQAMGELAGHGAYIYGLTVLRNGDIASSSEDRTVKVWRNGQCIQTITHPAVSIWTVTSCPETGDIATGASDRLIRIFSRDPDRQADAEVSDRFQCAMHRLTCIDRVLRPLTKAIALTLYLHKRRMKVCRSKRRIFQDLVSLSS